MTERDLSRFKYPNLAIIIGHAKDIDIPSKTVFLQDGRQRSYDKLCICTGAVPKVRQMQHCAISGTDFQAGTPACF